MNNKTKKVISIFLMSILTLMLAMSAFFKFMGGEEIVTGLTAVGFGHVIPMLGVVELLSVILFLVPNTRNIGFFLLCSYLGGAAAIEIAGGKFPIALVFIALAWISVYLRNSQLFLNGKSVIA